jgi:hypothetical protein
MCYSDPGRETWVARFLAVSLLDCQKWSTVHIEQWSGLTIRWALSAGRTYRTCYHECPEWHRTNFEHVDRKVRWNLPILYEAFDEFVRNHGQRWSLDYHYGDRDASIGKDWTACETAQLIHKQCWRLCLYTNKLAQSERKPKVICGCKDHGKCHKYKQQITKYLSKSYNKEGR